MDARTFFLLFYADGKAHLNTYVFMYTLVHTCIQSKGDAHKRIYNFNTYCVH